MAQLKKYQLIVTSEKNVSGLEVQFCYMQIPPNQFYQCIRKYVIRFKGFSLYILKITLSCTDNI